MQREERGNEGAAPESTRHPPEQHEQQHGVGEMEKQTDGVMPGRCQPEKLAIQRVRKPGEWMPITEIIGGQSPSHYLPGQTLPHERIVCHVFGVVIIEEIRMQHPPIADQRRRDQRQANEGRT